MKLILITSLVSILCACNSTDSVQIPTDKIISDTTFKYSFKVKPVYDVNKDTNTVGNLGYRILPNPNNVLAAVLIGAYKHKGTSRNDLFDQAWTWVT